MIQLWQHDATKNESYQLSRLLGPSVHLLGTHSVPSPSSNDKHITFA
jgi:hypothetical protein